MSHWVYFSIGENYCWLSLIVKSLSAALNSFIVRVISNPYVTVFCLSKRIVSSHLLLWRPICLSCQGFCGGWGWEEGITQSVVSTVSGCMQLDTCYLNMFILKGEREKRGKMQHDCLQINCKISYCSFLNNLMITITSFDWWFKVLSIFSLIGFWS